MNPSLKRLISIDPNNPINPDRDVCESGEFHLQASNSDEHMAEIFAPNGKFLGTIFQSRLAVLQRAFMQAAVTNPDKAEQATESHFAEAIAQLLVLYKDGHTTGACNTKLKNHWATPNVYMNALLQGVVDSSVGYATGLVSKGPRFESHQVQTPQRGLDKPRTLSVRLQWPLPWP